MSAERVLCAAVYVDDSVGHNHQPKNIKTGFVVSGWRHHNCLSTLYITTRKKAHEHPSRVLQGFLTTTNRYVDRAEAYTIAQREGQFIQPGRAGELYSEDIY